MEISKKLINNLEVGRTSNSKYLLAAEISEYFKDEEKPIDTKFVLGKIGKIGEIAVRQEFERSKKGEKPLALFIWLIKQHKVEYGDVDNSICDY